MAQGFFGAIRRDRKHDVTAELNKKIARGLPQSAAHEIARKAYRTRHTEENDHFSFADIERAKSVARRVHTGTIGINGYPVSIGAPFGGVKASGIGREFGPEAMSGYQQLKSIYVSA